MNMKDMIQRMTAIEAGNKQLNESAIAECGMDMPPMQQGTPVSMNVSLNASGTQHVEDLINMMKNAGMQAAEPVSAKILSPRMDMERLSSIMGEPEMGPEMEEIDDEIETDEDFENATTEPSEEYQDTQFMTKDLAGGINREKKQYAKAQDGDNAMAVEAIRNKLYAALSEKKAKPDFLDVDKDGDKKEPMKKALNDKGSKPKKGEVPAQFKKK